MASFLMRLSGLSLSNGMIGSMRTEVGTPLRASFSSASNRFEGGGAEGSSFFAILSSSVVMLMETMLGVFLRMSMSLVIRLDFVIIWSLQLCFESIFRHVRVKPRVFSCGG